MKLLLAVLLIAPLAHATEGGDHAGNGGDICEKRFADVRNDISSWITRGGSAGLRFPAPITKDQYDSSMLAQMKSATISCIDDKVFIGTAEKTCVNHDGAITCNVDRFLKTSESDQYVLVHHEYAGLAGFEENTGEASHYEISDQITDFLENQIVKKLAIKPAAPPASLPAMNDDEANARSMVACEAYRHDVNLAIINFIVSLAGVQHDVFDIGACKNLLYSGGKPFVGLVLPDSFTTTIFTDRNVATTLSFTMAKNYGDRATGVMFQWWWEKSAVYDHLGNLDGYNYRFLYTDETAHATYPYGVHNDYYYAVRNTKTGQSVGGARINNR